MDGSAWIAVIPVFMVSVVFSMFGQGGGSLYTPILFLLGYPALISISTSLTLNLITAGSAALVYHRQNLINLKTAVAFIPGICLGSLLGSAWGNLIDPTALMWLFFLFLLGAGGRMIYPIRETKAVETCPIEIAPAIYVIIVLFSFGVGVLAGLLGIGGGIMIVPFLIFICRYPAKESAGTVAFINIFSSFLGMIGHSVFGTLDLTLIAITGVSAMIGASIGARLMIRAEPGWIKVGFGLVMWAIALQLALSLAGLL